MLVDESLYFSSRGIDLKKELGGSTDNPSNEVNIFLINLENWLKNYVSVSFAPCKIQDENYINEALKEALLCQIDYVLLQGNKTVSDTKIKESTLAPSAYLVLKSRGLANTPHNTQRMPIQSIKRW